MRYKMLISYDGNYFKGSQRQKNEKTVQGEIEKVLSKINNKKVDMTFCGRTDTGVHARLSVVHFDLDKEVKLYNLKKALNNSLNEEIFVIDIKEEKSSFHARYDCIEKEYRYFINVGNYNLFERNYIYQFNKKLNINKMRKALKFLEGTHDFRSFCSDEKTKENCIRTITKTKIIKNNDVVEIRISGDGFLKHMVRNIVGVLIDNNDSQDIKYIQEILHKKSRDKMIKPAPSCGLYLWDVKYK